MCPLLASSGSLVLLQASLPPGSPSSLLSALLSALMIFWHLAEYTEITLYVSKSCSAFFSKNWGQRLSIQGQRLCFIHFYHQCSALGYFPIYYAFVFTAIFAILPTVCECVCVCVCVCAQALSILQLFLTPVDCSPPGSSVHGILQARTLERVAMPSSRGSSPPTDWTHVSDVSCIGKKVLYH